MNGKGGIYDEISSTIHFNSQAFGLLSVPHESLASSASQLLVINKKINQLAFFENGKLVKTYSVGGKTSKLTPEDSFFIREKIVNRPYYKLKIKGGDSRNPLGDRWMGLSVNEGVLIRMEFIIIKKQFNFYIL